MNFEPDCWNAIINPAKNTKEGVSDSNARVGFMGPEILVAPKLKAQAGPAQKFDHAKIAAATRTMSTPKSGGMGDIS